MPYINKEVLFKTLEYTASSTSENSTFLVASALSNEYAINVYVSAVGKGSLRFYIQNDSVLRIEANIQSGNWKYALDNDVLDNDNINHKFYIETPTATEITFRTEILYGQLEAALPVLSSTDKTKIEIQNGSWVSAENCNNLNLNGTANITELNIPTSSDLNVSNLNMTGENSNINVSGNVTASTLSINNLKSSNIQITGSNGVTIDGNTSIVGNLTIFGEITGQITQEQNALAGISSNTSIASENISEITITLDEQTNNKHFYADDTSKSKSYKVNIDSKPIYDKLNSQNTNLTGLINTNKENISNLTASLNTHKDQLTNKGSTHYSDIYATNFHGNSESATVATSVNTSKYISDNTVYLVGMPKYNVEKQTPLVISELDFDGTNIHANNCNLYLKSVYAESINATSMTVTEINGHTPFTIIQDSTGSNSYTYNTLESKFSNIDEQLKEAGKIDKVFINNEELAINSSNKSISINISKGTSNGDINVNNKNISIYELPVASSTEYGGVMVDSTIDISSSNPIENKVIAEIVKNLTEPEGNAYDNIYASTFRGDLIGKATSAESASSVYINENLEGTNYEYIPIMNKPSNTTGIFTSVEYLKYITSTNTLNASNINVSNNITASSINASNNIVATGSIQAAYFNAVSDKRLKTNIEKLPENIKACDVINNLDLYTFNYKNNLEERSLGIMAQDIENLNIDGFNFTNKDSDGYLSIKESKLIYLLMAAIKEQNKKIEELEERIKSLEE